MAFGQPSGPPATARQVRELLDLLQAAGHADFRDARGPMGFTQRQAGGKFTRDEADEFIARLQAQLEPTDGEESGVPGAEAAAPPRIERPARPSAAEQAVRRIRSEVLAAELQRRGWIVVEP